MFLYLFRDAIPVTRGQFGNSKFRLRLYAGVSKRLCRYAAEFCAAVTCLELMREVS